jgi:hypothetical protein
VEAIMSWAQTLREEGREEGREQGREEERAVFRASLTRLLEQRFDVVPDAVRARLASATGEQLQAWTDRVLGASSAEEVVERD